jgi:glycine betaine/choline ABC-type transport system substrate-binding protein
MLIKFRITFILASCLLVLQALSLPAQSCVGRILTLSVNDSLEQKVVGQLLATYITERTGTTVNMITGLDIKASEEQIKQCKADIFINYLNVGLSEMEDGNVGKDAQESYGMVKHYYGEKFNMVWLKPLGYKGPLLKDTDKAAATASLAIPVTTRDVLNRFPVLDRVINKLGGRLDKKTVQQLILETETKDVKTVVKNFLKDQNLI